MQRRTLAVALCTLLLAVPLIAKKRPPLRYGSSVIVSNRSYFLPHSDNLPLPTDRNQFPGYAVWQHPVSLFSRELPIVRMPQGTLLVDRRYGMSDEEVIRRAPSVRFERGQCNEDRRPDYFLAVDGYSPVWLISNNETQLWDVVRPNREDPDACPPT